MIPIIDRKTASYILTHQFLANFSIVILNSWCLVFTIHYGNLIYIIQCFSFFHFTKFALSSIIYQYPTPDMTLTRWYDASIPVVIWTYIHSIRSIHVTLFSSKILNWIWWLQSWFVSQCQGFWNLCDLLGLHLLLHQQILYAIFGIIKPCLVIRIVECCSLNRCFV